MLWFTLLFIIDLSIMCVLCYIHMYFSFFLYKVIVYIIFGWNYDFLEYCIIVVVKLCRIPRNSLNLLHWDVMREGS